AAYCTGRLPEPCGMYVLKNGPALARRGVLDFVSLSDQPDERIIGCGLTILGLTTTFFTDANIVNRSLFTANHSYRPDYLFYQNERRHHSIVLTWPPPAPRPRSKICAQLAACVTMHGHAPTLDAKAKFRDNWSKAKTG